MKLAPDSLATILTFAAVAIPAMTARAYELNETAGGFLHWDQPTLHVRIGPEVLERFGADAARAAIDAAAAAWALDGVPTLVVSDWPANPYTTDQPEVSVYLVSGVQWTYDDDQLANTNNDWLPGSGRIDRSDVVLNGNKPIAIDAGRGAYDLQSILTHEFGHVLGLDEDPSDDDSVMHPTISKGVCRRELTRDDARGARALYAEVRAESARLGACQAAEPGAERPRSFWDLLWVLAATVAYMWWLRRINR